MDRIFKWFGSRPAGFICIILALLSRIVSVFYFSYAGRDKMLLVLQSKNMLEGNGVSFPKYFTNQLSSPVYDYTQLWPPGYAFTLAPLLKLFNNDIYLSTTFLDLIVCVALIFVVRKLSIQLSFTRVATNLLTLLAGCYDYAFITESLPTDTISLLFFLIGFFFLLKIIQTGSVKPRNLIITAILLFLPCLYRYAYPPIVLSIPAAMIIFSWIKKERLMLIKGVWIFGSLLSVLLIYYIVLKVFTGSAGYVTPTERGFFPENIVHWYPVIPGSFVDLPLLTSQLIKISGAGFQNIMSLLEIINILSAIIISLIILLFLFKEKSKGVTTFFRWPVLLGFVAVVINCLLLGYLSFTYEVQKGSVSNWNYITEARYFAVAYIFFQFLFIGYLFKSSDWSKIFWKKFIIIGGLVLFVAVILHNLYFYTKVGLDFREYKSNVYREQDYDYFKTLLAETQKNYPDCDIVAGAPGDNYYAYTAAYYDKKGLFDTETLKNKIPAVQRNTIMLIMLYDHELKEYHSFISDYRVEKKGKIQYSNFYIARLNP